MFGSLTLLFLTWPCWIRLLKHIGEVTGPCRTMLLPSTDFLDDFVKSNNFCLSKSYPSQDPQTWVVHDLFTTTYTPTNHYFCARNIGLWR
jgi:hypothetical protein